MTDQPGRSQSPVDPQRVKCPACDSPPGWACRVLGVPVLPHHARVSAAAREDQP